MLFLGGASKNHLKKIVDQISKDNILMGEAIGEAGTKPEQYIRFEQLSQIASTDQLLELTKHSNGVVRCYAFKALTERKDVKIFPIILKYLPDTELIETQFGCIKSLNYPGDIILNMVYDFCSYELKDGEIKKIEEILILEDDINLIAKTQLIKEIEPEARYYYRFREMLIKEKRPEAIVAISKFKNKQDNDLIIDLLNDNDKVNSYYGLWAVSNYPDQAFFPYIKQIWKDEINSTETVESNSPRLRMLYQALVMYRSSVIYDLLEKTLDCGNKNIVDQHSKYIWLALKKHPCDMFNSLLSKIKLPENDRKELEYWLDNPG